MKNTKAAVSWTRLEILEVALRDERRSRQALEARVARLEGALTSLEAERSTTLCYIEAP
jgi:BMFP domain-containing protein YqiC